MKRFLLRFGTMAMLTLICVLLMSGLASASESYTVQNGDSLFLVAKRFGVSVNEIKAASGLSGNDIYPGQRLVIPGGSGSDYIVQKGDTISRIAAKYGITIDSIRKTNNLWKDFIYPGQALKIPGGKSEVAYVTSRGGYSRSDLTIFARAVYAEARGESYEGQVAVAAVILNRVRHPDFPNSIPGVIYEPGAFSCVDDGQINMIPDDTAYKAVQDAINGWDPTKGAIYYWNPVTAQSKWIWSRPITLQIGNHVFAK